MCVGYMTGRSRDVTCTAP